jgi:hypothetical protein
VTCQLCQAFRIDPATDKPDESEPCIVVYCTDLESTEIPAAQREAARHYILQAGDPFTSIPLLAPEQEAFVCFKDERDGYRFFYR